jgi:hypothetical protein
MLEGRRLHTKLSEGWLADADSHARRTDAEHGSLMLKNAILRSLGYHVPEPFVRLPATPAPPPPTPKFKDRTAKRGRPRKSRKAYQPNAKIAQIQALVAAHFGLTASEMTGQERGYKIAHPRQIAMYLARKATRASYPSIAKQFGGKHHTSVLHAFRKVNQRIENGDRTTIAAICAVHGVIGA